MQLDISEGPMERPVVFRINDNGMGPELLQQVFLERGWVEYDDEIHSPDEWNLWWRTSRFRTGEYSSLLPWQHINHFPSCTLITKKDALCRNLRKMKVAHGLHVYNFGPIAFNLPNDYTKFVYEYASCRTQAEKEGVTPPMWICKPAESSRGRGIFIFEDLSELQYDCNAVVQQYITNPLLIGGFKFDIRVYVAIPSFHPLRVYVHEEGIVRFGTEKFDLARPDNVFSHLTNTSINKFSPGYSTDKDEVGPGCKWTISQLRRYFLQNNINDSSIWKQITSIITLTVLMQAPSAPKMSNCFELYGFDILIDTNLKAWLLEVNFSPALSSDCPVDVVAKKSMLHDLMSLVQVTPMDQDRLVNVHGQRFYGRDPDTARTVASTISHFSHASGSSSTLHPNTSHHSISPTRGKIKKRRTPNNNLCGGGDNNRAGKQPPLSEHVNGNRNENHSSIQNEKDANSNNSPKGQNHDRMIIGVPSMEQLSSKKGGGKHHLESHEVNEDDILRFGTLPDILHSAQGAHDRNNLAQTQTPVSEHEAHLDVTEQLCQGVSEDNFAEVEKWNGNTSVTLENRQRTRAPSITLDLKGVSGHIPVTHQDNNGQSLAVNDGKNKNYELVVVKGNMRGQGEKHVISPIPSINNIHRERQNRIASMSTVSKKHDRHSAPDDSLRKMERTIQRSQSRFHSSPCHGSPEREGRNSHSKHPHWPPGIPRNFNRTEMSRFPMSMYQNQHYNSPGKNGAAPLSKIPPKNVGRLFLIFPFNEATQKFSLADLDTRQVIKEIVRDAKSRKPRDLLGQGTNRTEGIWCPLNKDL